MSKDTKCNHPAPSEDSLLDNKYRHVKEDCVAYQEGGMGCPDCYCDSSCKDDSCHICGGNTPERVEEQIEWLKKIAEEEE